MKLINCSWSIDNTTGSWLHEHEHRAFAALPSATSRRLTPLGRQALQVLSTCSTDHPIPWIISCRNGDVQRRLNLLSNLAEGELLSPTDFSLSVHNAIIGVYSIAKGNKLAHSGLASGPQSFEAGLFEAIALHKDKGGMVGYLYYDYVEMNKLTDHLNHESKAEYFACMIGEGSDDISIEYNHINTNCSNKFNLIDLINYLKSDEKRFQILSFGGGEFLFERV